MVQYCSFWHAGALLRLPGFIPPPFVPPPFCFIRPAPSRSVPSHPSRFVPSVPSVPLRSVRSPGPLRPASLPRSVVPPPTSGCDICLPSLNRPQKRPAPHGTGLVRLPQPVRTGRRLYCCCLTYLSSQPKNSRFQTIEFWGLKTWCASSSNSTSRAGTPCRRAAVKASSDCV